MNLFKLKKDGKLVGYVEFYDNWGAIPNYHLYYEDGSQSIFTYPDPKQEKLLMDCEIFPYVCDDRNGDKVFTGDKVRLSFPDEDTFESKIVWSELCWQIEGGGMLENFVPNNIELVKDDTND